MPLCVCIRLECQSASGQAGRTGGLAIMIERKRTTFRPVDAVNSFVLCWEQDIKCQDGCVRHGNIR
jgi:hypothetical protein